MLRIKDDRMNELEKFGFEKGEYNSQSLSISNLLVDVCGNGDILLYADNISDIEVTEFMAKFYELVKANMVEEVTE